MKDPMISQGVAALIAGDTLRAVSVLREFLQRYPYDPIVHFDLAVAYRLRGELPLALGHARLSMELAQSARAHALYGLHLQLARVPDQARVHLERALQLEPEYRLGAMMLGLLAREQGLREEARVHLERALIPGPGELPVLVAERVRGQLFDLERGGSGVVEARWCSVTAVTEILRQDGTALVLEPRLEPVTVRPSPARELDAEQVARRIFEARRIVALTGAGISSASGLRTRKQLWQRYDRDAAVSAIGVRQDPSVLWTVVRDFLGGVAHPPNAAHEVLARLPQLAAIVTQNVDELHQRAARPDSQAPVFELHGTLERMRCTQCGELDANPASTYVAAHPLPPHCDHCHGRLRPDVVLFGEPLPARVLERALEEVTRCDLLLVVGCAMDVAPASELPRLAAGHGARVIELKRTPSRVSDAIGSELLLGPAEETLPEVYRHLSQLVDLPALPAPSPPVPAPEPLLAPVPLPPLGESVREGTLARWLRKPGEEVKQGEPIAEFDSDKCCVEIEAPISGVVRSLRISEGDTVEIHEIIAEIEPQLAPPSSRRVEEASLLNFVWLGTHATAIFRELERLEQARWMLPADVPALEAEIPELVQAHARALHPEVPLAPWITRDPAEAMARLQRDRPHAEPVTLAWEGALPSHPPISKRLADFVSARIRWRVKELHGQELNAQAAISMLASRWLGGLVHHGQDRDPPCPYAAVLEIYRRGAWPFALRGGIVGVFVPEDTRAAAAVTLPYSFIHRLDR